MIGTLKRCRNRVAGCDAETAGTVAVEWLDVSSVDVEFGANRRAASDALSAPNTKHSTCQPLAVGDDAVGGAAFFMTLDRTAPQALM